MRDDEIVDSADQAPWTVGQLRAELVGLPADLPVIVLVQDNAGGTFFSQQVLVGAGYGEGVDRDEPQLVDRAFPLRTRLNAARC